MSTNDEKHRQGKKWHRLFHWIVVPSVAGYVGFHLIHAFPEDVAHGLPPGLADALIGPFAEVIVICTALLIGTIIAGGWRETWIAAASGTALGAAVWILGGSLAAFIVTGIYGAILAGWFAGVLLSFGEFVRHERQAPERGDDPDDLIGPQPGGEGCFLLGMIVVYAMLTILSGIYAFLVPLLFLRTGYTVAFLAGVVMFVGFAFFGGVLFFRGLDTLKVGWEDVPATGAPFWKRTAWLALSWSAVAAVVACTRLANDEILAREADTGRAAVRSFVWWVVRYGVGGAAVTAATAAAVRWLCHCSRESAHCLAGAVVGGILGWMLTASVPTPAIVGAVVSAFMMSCLSLTVTCAVELRDQQKPEH